MMRDTLHALVVDSASDLLDFVAKERVIKDIDEISELINAEDIAEEVRRHPPVAILQCCAVGSDQAHPLIPVRRTRRTR